MCLKPGSAALARGDKRSKMPPLFLEQLEEHGNRPVVHQLLSCAHPELGISLPQLLTEFYDQQKLLQQHVFGEV